MEAASEISNYAKRRIRQKKWLMQHFVCFLAGALLLIILNPVLGVGKDFWLPNWHIWVILFWVFWLVVHFLNVFLVNKFMGEKWENAQYEKLKLKQYDRLAAMQQEIDHNVPVHSDAKTKTSKGNSE